jgi:hypothetical protein
MAFALEDQLLIQCSRVTVDAEAIGRAADLLAHSLDWDYLVETSVRHAVAPLFYHGLQQVQRATGLDHAVPPTPRQELHDLYQRSGVRNTRLYRVISSIATAFARDAIPVMGLKDVQLAWQVYPEVGLRPMGDVDLLIHHHDYDRAAACLAGLGFSPRPSADIPFTRKYAWAHHFHRPADNVWADVQWNVLQLEWDTYDEGNFDFEIDRMWRGAIPMDIDDAALLVPRPEDMLFHLCLHLEGHQYAELILFCDIAEMLRHYAGQLDWRYLVGLAHRYGVESSLYYALWLVHRLFPVDLPAPLWQELSPAYFKAAMFESLFGNLTPLHLSLDELRQAAHPPAVVMIGFEATARLQAAAAMRLYREMDALASAFIAEGGRMVVFEGSPSERILPDPRLRPFEEMHLLVLDHDLRALARAMAGCGFAARNGQEGGNSCEQGIEAYMKEWNLVSRDPALAGSPARISVYVDLATGLDAVLPSLDGKPRPKKDIALDLCKARLAGRRGTRDVEARLRVVALSPEDMLVYLSARQGKREVTRLFGLTSLLEFFRRYTGPISWDEVVTTARQHGLSAAVGEGLAMAAELLPGDRVPPGALVDCASPDARPPVLRLARYSLDSLGLYTDLRAPFLYVLNLLAIPGLGARAKFVLRSLAGSREHTAVLPRLLWQTGAGLLSRLRPGSRPTITGMAYWVEIPPDTAPIPQVERG